MNRKALAWAFYDFANTIFSMNVLSLYFPLFVSVDLGLGDSYVSFANSGSMLLAGFLLPILGTISDERGGKILFLLLFTLSCATATIFIGIFANLYLPTGVIISFMIANLSYQIALGFYNTFLEKVSSQATIGKISGIGTALGYLGSIAGLVLVAPFNTGKFLGHTMGFIKPGGRSATFIPTALLFLIFSIPIFIFLWEWDFRKSTLGFTKQIALAFARVINSLKDTRAYPGVRRFLVAKFFYEEGIQTAIIFMGIYADKVVGLSDSIKVTFFVVATTGSVIGSILSGIITDRLGHKKSLSIFLAGWVISLMALVILKGITSFVVLGVIIGALLGSVWTSARPLLVELVPASSLGQFFGLYGLVGKTASVFGPLLWATVLALTSKLGTATSYRFAVLSLAIMILSGLIILQGMNVGERKSK